MWKDIIGWEGLYEISDDGHVRNKLTKKIRKNGKNSTGYERVCLYNKNHNPPKERFFIHRLVAIHYIDNPLHKMEVNHKDCNIHNNNVGNLEWADKYENELHSRKYGAKVYKPILVSYKNGDNVLYETSGECARAMSVTRRTVANWASGLFNVNARYGIENIQYV